MELEDKETSDYSPEANMRKALRIFSKTPTALAAFYRIRSGKKIIKPKKSLSFSENFFFAHLSNVNLPGPNILETRCVFWRSRPPSILAGPPRWATIIGTTSNRFTFDCHGTLKFSDLSFKWFLTFSRNTFVYIISWVIQTSDYHTRVKLLYTLHQTIMQASDYYTGIRQLYKHQIILRIYKHQTIVHASNYYTSNRSLYHHQYYRPCHHQYHGQYRHHSHECQNFLRFAYPHQPIQYQLLR